MSRLQSWSRLRPQTRESDETGGAGLFGIGLGVCVGMILTGGVTVTAAQLARSDIMDAAAHASAASADRISEGAVYAGGVDAVTLERGAASSEANAVLTRTPLPKRVSSWRVTNVEVTGKQVHVTVTAIVNPPVIGSALSALGMPMTVTVDSRADAHVATSTAP